jgi:hypothetical protein
LAFAGPPSMMLLSKKKEGGEGEKGEEGVSEGREKPAKLSHGSASCRSRLGCVD